MKLKIFLISHYLGQCFWINNIDIVIGWNRGEKGIKRLLISIL